MQPKGARRWVAIAVPLLLVLIAFVKISVGTLLFLVTAEAVGLWLVYEASMRSRDMEQLQPMSAV